MSGRRGHHRLTIGSPTSGAVRVRRDVVIERMEGQELVAVSQTPAVVGEEMFLELFSGSDRIALKVRVLDSRPAVIAGSMRHRLRVVVMTVGALATQTNREPLADSPTTPENA
jgi:hypothetical protein